MGDPTEDPVEGLLRDAGDLYPIAVLLYSIIL